MGDSLESVKQSKTVDVAEVFVNETPSEVKDWLNAYDFETPAKQVCASGKCDLAKQTGSDFQKELDLVIRQTAEMFYGDLFNDHDALREVIGADFADACESE